MQPNVPGVSFIRQGPHSGLRNVAHVGCEPLGHGTRAGRDQLPRVAGVECRPELANDFSTGMSVEVWRASEIPDTGSNRVRPGMEDGECQNGVGSLRMSSKMR